MKKEIRAVPCGGWPLEVYRFENITQSFPNHFHDYCVIGLVEAGTLTSFFQMYIGLPPGVYGRIYSQTPNEQYLTAYHSRKKGRKDEY